MPMHGLDYSDLQDDNIKYTGLVLCMYGPCLLYPIFQRTSVFHSPWVA